MLHQVRTRFEDQTSLQINSGGSSDEDSDYADSVGQPVEWTVVRGHAGKFTRADPITASASNHATNNQVDDAAPRGRWRQQSAEAD